MHSLRKPIFLPVWASNLFNRVAEHSDDDQWYGRMMEALLECDNWNDFYHRQTAALLATLVAPTAGSASNLVNRTIELHQDRSTDRCDWNHHYHSLFHVACIDPCLQYSPSERQAIKASLHGCLETPLHSRPYDPVWSVIFAISSTGGCEDSGWNTTAHILLDSARHTESTVQFNYG